MKNDVEFLDQPIEISILRDGKPLMSQVFRHTPIRFGRILENDIVLPFEGVSRHHCVLHYREGAWQLEDLKSLNGVEVNGERVASATFEEFGAFELKPVTIQIKAMKPLEATLTSTRVDPLNDLTIDHDKTFILPQEPSHPAAQKTPLLQIDGVELMSRVQPQTTAHDQPTAQAVQVTIAWHEVLLNVEEFIVGEDMIVELNGIHLRLGRVSNEQADIRCPTGTNFLDIPARDAVLLPGTTAVWVADDGLRIFARYVPQSKRKSIPLIPYIDGDLIDPLVYSGVAHSAVAIAAISMTIKPPVLPKIPPVRMARIIAEAPRPTPAPVVAATPTPTPPAKPIVSMKPVPKLKSLKFKPKALVKTATPRPRVVTRSFLLPTKLPPKVVTPLPTSHSDADYAIARKIATSAPKSATRPPEQILKVIQKHQSWFQSCYDRNPAAYANLSGGAGFEVEISPDGTVVPESIRAQTSAPKNGEKLFECLKVVFQRLKFPRSKDGATSTQTIGLPLGRL